MQTENERSAESAQSADRDAASPVQGEGPGGAKADGSESMEGREPAAKKQKTSKEAEELLNAATVKTAESKVLLQTASELLATFKHLARNPQDAQREDDDSKSALLEVLKLRHEYATHPEGWVARKKRITRETAQRWGVTDSGALCSRVGPNYQALVPDFVGTAAYEPIEICTPSYQKSSMSEDAVQAYLHSLEPHYQKYVLQRRAERTSYRDMGTFREYALEQLHRASFDAAAATKAITDAIARPAGWEEGLTYEVWSASQARSYKAGAEKYNKNFTQIKSKHTADKPIKALISFYYRAKHVDGACRRGPVLLVSNSGAAELEGSGKEEEAEAMAPKGPQDVATNNWLQMRCECRRWLRVHEQFRHLYQICPDCEKVLCMCPACSTAVVLPHNPQALCDTAPAEPAYACPNCSHLL